MTRGRRSNQSVERRLDALESDTRNPDGWRARLDLPPDATRADGWRAFLRGEGDGEAWETYLAAGGTE